MTKDIETDEGAEELEGLVEIDEAELDVEELDDELGDTDEVGIEDEDDDAVVELVEEEEEEAVEAAVRPAPEVEDDDIEIVNEDDVEESLDEILKSRMVVEDEPEDDEGVDVEDRTEKPDTVLPKQADEFRCSNCFLIKKSSQLADEKRQLCRDCV
jgi:Domain of unknown function (DUF4193)